MGAPRSAKRKDWPLNLYQKSDGYFWYKNPNSGKTHGIGHDRAHAFREARAANAALASLKPSSLVEKVLGLEQKTFLQWLDDYLPLWEKETSPAAGTIEGAKRLLNRMKTFDMAWMNMKDITTQHVSTAIDKLLSESTPSVAINLRARLSDVFRMAETKGLIDTGRNPVTATSVPAYEVKRERLSLEQFLAIRKLVPPWAQNAMDLALLTGQRRGDIVEMKFADFREGSLFITQAKTGYKLQQDGKIRLEAINMSIEEAVKKCRTRVISKNLIHHHRSSGNYKAGNKVSEDGLTAAFKSGRIASGIEATEGRTPPTFHEIRSLAERLYKKEYGQEFAQSIMGHKHAKMTAEYDDTRGGDWKIISAK